MKRGEWTMSGLRSGVWSVGAALGVAASVALAQAPGSQPPATQPPAQAPGAKAGVQAPLAVKGASAQQVGTVSPLDIVRGSFVLRNMSNQPVTVTKVEAGCRCTYAAMVNPVIPPGGEGTLNYQIDVRGTMGELRKPIYLRCAGFDKMNEVVVQGQLQYAVTAEPAQLRPKGAPNAEFTLKSSDGTPFSVLSVAGRTPDVVSSNPPGGTKALSWTLRFTPEMQWPYAVVVETDHPKAPVVDMRVMGGETATPEVKFVKNINDIGIGRHMINLGVVPEGGSTEFDFYITRIKDYGKPVSVTTDGGDVKLELVKMGPWARPDDDHLLVKATFKPGVKGTMLFPVYVETEGSQKPNRTWACAIVK